MNLQRVRELAGILRDTRIGLGQPVNMSEVLTEAMEIASLDPKDQRRALITIQQSIGAVIAFNEHAPEC
jgi:hypothetical protein